MDTSFRQSRLARGFTLIELMVALAIGLLMAFGLVRVFASSSDSYRALAQASQQIENGRYALQAISQDLQHAGFYGEFSFVAAAAGGLPDPCEIANTATMKTDLRFHVQGYNNVNTGGDVPPACIDNANVVTGTDILVIRRASTSATAIGALVANEVYIQATAESTNPVNPVIAFGAAPGSFPLVKKDTVTPAEIRKYQVIIYFVSPCSEPVGGATAPCTGAADGGRPIPTLKRLMLGLSGGALAMRLESIAEGIENLQIDYGIDTNGDGAADNDTNGDGLAEPFVGVPPTVAQWGDVVSAQVHVLARNVDPSPGWNDTKTYNLGTTAYTPTGANTAFQRHLFTSQVRLVNPAGRRETP